MDNINLESGYGRVDGWPTHKDKAKRRRRSKRDKAYMAFRNRRREEVGRG